MNIYTLKKTIEPDLLKIQGVNGVGIQKNQLIVYVEKITRFHLNTIPHSINGIPVKIKQIGKIQLVQRTSKWRPCPAGVSIGHYSITAGTLGLPVKKNNEIMILSNNHVLAAMDSLQNNRAQKGDSIIQPGAYDGGTELDKIGELSQWIKYNEQDYNTVDCALAKPIEELLFEVLDLGILNENQETPPIQAREGMLVMKSGRTTGITTGRVLDVNATIKVNSPIGELLFKGQILSNLKCAGGDSGSLVFDAQGNPVGLLFAGSDSFSVFNKATNVASALSIGFPSLTITRRELNLFPIPIAIGGITLMKTK